MIIGNFSTGDRVLIVAEVGNNHEGNFEIAKELVHKAAECGVDAVKFQTFNTENYVSRSNVERFNQLKRFELTYSQFEELSRLAKSLGLLFISTPLDLPSARFLEAIVDAMKIASGDNNFYHLIAQVARTNKPLIISLGLADAEHAERTVAFVKRQWEQQGLEGQLALLHCVSSYPVPPDQANLRSIQFLAEKFECSVGYSDHTLGIEAALLAVALGACIIEKHFTLDKNYSDFRDHQLSADPAEMRLLVEKVRLASSMLGKHEKKIQPAEEPGLQAFRRSIVAGRDLPRGHRIAWGDLTWIRPAVGLPPGEEGRLLDRKLKRNLSFGEPILPVDVE